MKKLFLIRTLIFLIPFSLCVFTGCGKINIRKFDAKIVDTGFTFKEDFFKANMTYGAYYTDENGKDVRDKTSPEYRTFMITEKTQLDEVFSVFPGIDLKKEMLVMYAYTSYYNGRRQKITSIKVDQKKLKIKFRYVYKRPFIKDASAPQHRFLVIRMDKLNIDTVEFKLLNPDG